jgi:hypothetical protein
MTTRFTIEAKRILAAANGDPEIATGNKELARAVAACFASVDGPQFLENIDAAMSIAAESGDEVDALERATHWQEEGKLYRIVGDQWMDRLPDAILEMRADCKCAADILALILAADMLASNMPDVDAEPMLDAVAKQCNVFYFG